MFCENADSIMTLIDPIQEALLKKDGIVGNDDKEMFNQNVMTLLNEESLEIYSDNELKRILTMESDSGSSEISNKHVLDDHFEEDYDEEEGGPRSSTGKSTSAKTGDSGLDEDEERRLVASDVNEGEVEKHWFKNIKNNVALE